MVSGLIQTVSESCSKFFREIFESSLYPEGQRNTSAHVLAIAARLDGVPKEEVENINGRSHNREPVQRENVNYL